MTAQHNRKNCQESNTGGCSKDDVLTKSGAKVSVKLVEMKLVKTEVELVSE